MRIIQIAVLVAILGTPAFASETAPASEDDVISRVDALFAARRPQEAIDLLQGATAQDLPAAQAELAGLYFGGVYLAQDHAMAEKLLRDAISDPKPEYKRDLACVLHHRGGRERLKESIDLIQQASAAGDLLAMVYESRLYRLGVERPANFSVANYKLEQALKRVYEPADVEDEAESAFLRAQLPHILANGVCGPSDADGAFLAKSFPMRYRPWPARGKRSPTNPLFQYLPSP